MGSLNFWLLLTVFYEIKNSFSHGEIFDISSKQIDCTTVIEKSTSHFILRKKNGCNYKFRICQGPSHSDEEKRRILCCGLLSTL